MHPIHFSWPELLQLTLRLLTALVLALPIGYEREIAVRSAGLRTFPLVSIGACAYVLVATALMGTDPEAHSRVLQGLMTGIGFVGGGAILKDGKTVSGMSTAASLWVTSALGAAVGYGQVELAMVLTITTVVILRVLYIVEVKVGAKHRAHEDDPS